MAVQISIPTPLRNLTGGADTVPAEGATIGEILDSLEASHPGIKNRICDESGNVRRFVNIYINGEDIRFLDEKATPVKETDEVSIIPAIAGG